MAAQVEAAEEERAAAQQRAKEEEQATRHNAQLAAMKAEHEARVATVKAEVRRRVPKALALRAQGLACAALFCCARRSIMREALNASRGSRR